MPMIPGFLGVAAFAAVKISGYAGFAKVLNGMLERSTPVWKFGIARAVIGLGAGLLCLGVSFATGIGESSSDVKLYLLMVPLRLATWALALKWFYGFREQTVLVRLAVVVGTVLSYLLDVAGALLLSIPGMMVGFC